MTARVRRWRWKPRRGQRLWFPGWRSRLFPPGEWRWPKRKRGDKEGGGGG